MQILKIRSLVFVFLYVFLKHFKKVFLLLSALWYSSTYLPMMVNELKVIHVHRK